MKSEELMAREDSKLAGMCSKLAGTSFTIRKNEILMKFLELKRSRIGIILEFQPGFLTKLVTVAFTCN
jgi:hypothetical protein